MPRNGSGVYSLPAQYEATDGEDATALQHNLPLEDIQSDLNAARPVSSGGTGATTAQTAVDNLFLTGTKVTDASLLVVDPDDNTKRARLDVAGVTAGQTRVLTVPDANTTVVGTDTTQTLTNKTLTAPAVSAPVVTGGATITGGLVLDSTDAGATAGPDLDLYRNSASPAASDILGRLLFNGEDSAGNKELYAYLRALIGDPTSASEDAAIEAFTVVAGTLARRLVIGAGMYMDGATGGDKGAGTVNATEVYKNGTAMSVQDFAVKAHVHFSGVTTAAIQSSYNVSSVTRDAAGVYTITFASPLANDDYSIFIQPMSTVSDVRMFGTIRGTGTPTEKTTTEVQIVTANAAGSFTDAALVSVLVI